ncbi:MAG: YkvA family protein [Pikeienuella sp.]
MSTAELSAYVEDCLAKEGAKDHFMARLAEMANTPEHAPSESDAECLSILAVDYLRAVVGMLQACEAAAERTGARGFADPLIKIAVHYFFEPDDLIPDSMGLYGLIDDAYLAHKFIIGLSELVEAEKGFPLLATATDESIVVIRGLIGDEIATKLDAKVETNIRSVTVRNQMARLSMLSGTLPTHDSALWAKVKADRERISWQPKSS